MDKIEQNIRKTIARMKTQGTTGASVACLNQNTSTRGVGVPVGEYKELFAKIAARVAKEVGFSILNDGT